MQCSFKQGNDATQYNIEPYFNPDKPRLEPNMSFDLCRLAIIYDEVVDDPDDLGDSAIAKLINEWCKMITDEIYCIRKMVKNDILHLNYTK